MSATITDSANTATSANGPSTSGSVTANTAAAGSALDDKSTTVTDNTKSAIHQPVDHNVNDAVPHFQKIETISELESMDFAGNEKAEENKKRIQWLLNKVSFDTKSADTENAYKDFINAHVCKEGKSLILDIGGTRAKKLFFNTGFITVVFGWIGRLISRFNNRAGLQFAKNNSIVNLFDPDNTQLKAPPLKNILNGLETGQYSVSAHYDIDDDGVVSKTPDALFLVDNLGTRLKLAKEAITNSGIPEEEKHQAAQEIEKLQDEGLNDFVISDTVIINTDKQDKYMGSAGAGKRQRLLAANAESMSSDTSIFYPMQIFTNEDNHSSQHEYSLVHNLKTIEMLEGGQTQEATFNGTLVRPPSAKHKSVPSDDMSKMIAMHRLEDMITDPTQMTEEISFQLMDVTQQNKAIFDKFNEEHDPQAKAAAEAKRAEEAKQATDAQKAARAKSETEKKEETQE